MLNKTNASSRNNRRSNNALMERLEGRQLLSAAPSNLLLNTGGNNPAPIIANVNTNTAGQLDPSFGTGGKTTVNFGGPAVEATAVATEFGGKTVEVGYASSGNGASEFAIVQLNFNGTPDTSFGPHGNGIVYLQPGSSSDESGAEAVAVDGQGRILVAGSNNIVTVDSAGVSSDIYVARYLPNGTLDTTFGNHGVADIHFGFKNASDARGIALQSNGKIVVVGLNKGLVDNEVGIGNVDFAIARLNTNGSLDSSFNGGGTETEGFSGVDAYANAVTIDYSGTPAANPHFGTILVSGYTNSGSVSRMAAIRLKPNGGLDSSFNGSGKVGFIPAGFSGGDATGVVVQSTGDIVISGTLGTHNDGGIVGNGQFGLVRLTPAGHLDTTFANGTGFDTVAYGPKSNGDNTDFGDSLLLGPNNRLIVGGSSGGITTLVGFTASGQLDSTFGSGGIVTTNFGSNTSADGLAYLGDRIVAAGGGKFDTARYIDTTPTVDVAAFITSTTEHPAAPLTFLVTRSQALPYDTYVNFSIGGTAVSPTNLLVVRNHREDYTLSGMSIPFFGLFGQPLPAPSVDIPAGQSYVLVTLTPIDHGSTPELTKTASFSILPNTFYNAGTQSSLTVKILGTQASTSIAASANAYVQDGADANTNYGSSTSLVVKTGPTGFTRYTYLKFDLSNVSTINSVQLQLNGFLTSGTEGSVTTDVFSVANTSWTQNGITFNNAPAAGATPLASATITGTAATTYAWDVTAYVKAQKAAGNNIVSFVLKDPLETNPAVIFNTGAAGNGPTLVVS